MNKTILFSGRYDKPHIGHIITIQQLAEEYEKVIVCILDYPGQFYTIEERVRIMKKVLSKCTGNYQVITNKTNFEKITKQQMEDEGIPEFTHYGSGNFQCFMNMFHLGYKSVSINRTPGYAASSDVKYQKLIKFFEDEGYFK